MSNEKKIHLGIYGLNFKGEKILMIRKNRGPYKGKFDLPGGSIEFGEPFEVALKREIMEETGAHISDMKFLSNENYFCRYKKDEEIKEFHHVGLYYKVKIKAKKILDKPDGEDSDGALYVLNSKINSRNTSPIAYKVIKKFLKEN